MSSGTSWPASMYRRASMPDGRAIADGGPEQVARRDDRDAQAIREERRLRALPGARSAEQDDDLHLTAAAPAGGDHRMKPSYWRISSCASSCFIVSTTTDTTIRMLVPPRARFWNVGLDEPDERRQRGDDAQEQRAGDGDPGHDAGKVVLRRAGPAGCPG